MNIIDRFNMMHQNIVKRSEIEETKERAQELGYTDIYKRLAAVLDNNDDSEFKVNITNYPYSPDYSLEIAGMAGMYPNIDNVDEADESYGMNKGVSPNDIYQMITDRMLEKIKKATGKNYVKKWDAKTYGKGYTIPFNFVSKKRYRGVNAFLLTDFEPLENPFFLTFKQVDELKGSIIKGSRSYKVVYFTRLYKYEQEEPKIDIASYNRNKFKQLAEQNKDKIKPLKAGLDIEDFIDKNLIPILKYYNVFNGKDIKGIDFDLDNFKIGYIENELPTSENTDKLDIPEAIIANYPDPQPKLKFGGNKASYRPIADVVKMPYLTDFETVQDYYRTLFHEYAHSTGNYNRLDRDMSGNFGSKKYAFEELIAEWGAVFLSAQAGIIYHTNRNHAEYIKNWNTALTHIKDDNKFIMRACSKAQELTDFVLQFNENGDPKYFSDLQNEQPVKELIPKYETAFLTLNPDNKLELHFEIEDYKNNVSEEDKKVIKRNFIWGRKRKAWVGRRSIGFVPKELEDWNLPFIETESSLTTPEELRQRQIERSLNKADRFEDYAASNLKKANDLQKDFRELKQDWSWLTQPNINTAGGRSFTNSRNKVLARYEKGFEKMQKAGFQSDKADLYKDLAKEKETQLKNASYLENRIKESKKALKNAEEYFKKADELLKKDLPDWKRIDITARANYLKQHIAKLAYYNIQLDKLNIQKKESGEMSFDVFKNRLKGFSKELKKYFKDKYGIKLSTASKAFGTGFKVSYTIRAASGDLPSTYTGSYASNEVANVRALDLMKLIDLFYSDNEPDPDPKKKETNNKSEPKKQPKKEKKKVKDKKYTTVVDTVVVDKPVNQLAVKVDDNGQYGMFGAKQPITNDTANRIIQNKNRIQGIINKKITGTTESKIGRSNSRKSYYDNPNNGKDLRIHGTTGEFLGVLEIKPKESLVITIDAGPGAGKTTMIHKLMNDFALTGLKCAFLTLEQHKYSRLAREQAEQFINHEFLQNTTIEPISDDEVKTIKELDDIFSRNDAVFIDSFQKLRELLGKLKVDKDLRKRYDGKIIVLIFQRTKDGKMRGGSDCEFDGDVIIKGEPGETFDKNIFYHSKNRYANCDISKIAYNVANHVVFDPTIGMGEVDHYETMPPQETQFITVQG